MSFIAQRQAGTSLRDSVTTMASKRAEPLNFQTITTRKGCCGGLGVHPFVLAAMLASCAGKPATPGPVVPSPEPSVSAERAAASAPVAGGSPSATAAPEPSVAQANGAERTDGLGAAPGPTASASEPAPAPAPLRTPSDMLTARDVAFLIDEQGSGLRAIFDVECDKSVKPDDETAKAECVSKARSKFQPDVLRFEMDERGKVTLSIYKRVGTTLKEAYVAGVSFSDETPEGVKVAISGREQGQRPLFKSGSGLIRVPNDYSIVVEDPKFGELSYSAKIGLVGAR